MKVSIIIVNYNGGRHLNACLRSLLVAPVNGTEIIVVDNGSTDGSAAEVAADFPGVRLIGSADNLGYCGGSNLGAAHACGDFLVFLNPDTVVEPSWLAPLITVLASDPTAGLATSQILLMEGPERINAAGNEVHLTGLTLCRKAGTPREGTGTPVEVAAVSGAAFAIRRQLFQRLGGFDERFFMYMEDTDLSWRARLAGYRCLYVPDSVVYHDYRLRFGPHKVYYQERNRYLMLLKTLRWQTLLLLLPALLVAELVTWGFVLIGDRCRWTNKLHAYIYIFDEWSPLTKARRRVQATRQTTDRNLLQSATYRITYEQVSGGTVTQVSHLLFDPVFYIAQKLIGLLLWW